jgi:hypothetical protein
MRLFTKAGGTVTINLRKLDPIVGGAIGDSVDCFWIKGIDDYLKKNFNVV